MRKYTRGMIEVGMIYVERTIWTDGEKFYVRLDHALREVKHFCEDIWLLIY